VSDRQSVIGFTEAELGLFIAILFLALFVSGPSKNPGPQDVTLPKTTVDSLRQRVRVLTLQIDTLRGRRSRKRPSCREKGIASDYLLDVGVLSSSNFQVGRSVYTIRQLLQAVRSSLDSAATAGCVHEIRLRYRPGLSAEEYDTAVRTLVPYFDPVSLGPILK